MSEKPTHGHRWMPVMYATYFGILKDIAEQHGYALALHGTLGRDLDLVAVPWTDRARPHLELLQAFRKAIGIERADGLPFDSVEIKPHGRRAFTIASGGGGYLDISVVPGIPMPPAKESIEP